MSSGHLSNTAPQGEELYRLISENIGDVIWILNLETGMFTYVSPSVERLRGYTPAEVLLQPMSEVMTPESLQYISSALPARLAAFAAGDESKRTITSEINQYHKDGSIIPTEVVTTLLPDENGRVNHILGVTRDIRIRKQLEGALRESEQTFHSLFEHMLNGFAFCRMRFDQDGQPEDFLYLEVNRSFEHLTGLKNVKGKWVSEVIPGIRQSDPELFEIYGRVALSGKPETFETYLEALKMWFSVSVYSPRKEHFVAVFDVITRRKQVEAALRESEERFRSLFEQAAVGVALVETQTGRYIRINQKYCDFLGYPMEEILNLSFQAVTYPDDVQENEDNNALLLAGKIREFSIDKRYVRKDGQIVWGNLTVSPLWTPDKIPDVYLHIAVVQDISERKAYEAALKEKNEELSRAYEQLSASEEELRQNYDELLSSQQALYESEAFTRAVLDNLPVGVAVNSVDPAVVFNYVNDNFIKFYRISREELADPDVFWDVIYQDPDFRQAIKKRVLEDCASGDPQRMVWENIPITRQGEETTYISARNIPIPDKPLMISTVWDVTERIRAEEEKDRLQTQLLQSQKMESIGRLAGGVAHDYNNLLGVMIGHAEKALMKTPTASPLYHDLEEILDAARRSADLTRQLLAFARQQAVTPKVQDLNMTIAGMLKMLRRLIGEDIHLDWKPGDNLWRVKIDPSQFDQVLANLLVNARDAIRGVGQVVIETDNVVFSEAYCAQHAGYLPGQYVLLAIRDNGCGMDRETLSHLFEPFFTTKEIGKGTGLGLATVYGIIKQNNGFITVYSEPGHGSLFKLFLPRAEGEPETIEPSQPAAALQSGSETILLVEDEEALLELAKDTLEELGYVVLTASSPAEALCLAEKQASNIQLLISDVVMPGMNGLELLKQLKILQPNLKCLFMSGYTADIIAHRGILDHDVNFIQKPFLLTDLAIKVRSTLEKTT